MAPRVCVVVSLYNLGRWVGAAIDSVLGQTLPGEEVELIVVDDGSTDGGADVVRAYGARVRYLRQDNAGVSAARNAGLRATEAPFVGFLDADDRLLPEKLAASLAVFDRRPEAGLVYTGFVYIDDTGLPLPQRGWATVEGDVLSHLVLGNLVHPHQPLVRREALVAAGGFDPSFSPAADWDLWLRLARAGLRWACVDRPLAEYRIRRDAMHQDVGRMVEECVRILDRTFAAPDLPAQVAALRDLAYRRVHLVAACDHYRLGQHAAGARWFRAAAEADAGFLTDPDELRRLCRLFLPLGHQRGTEVLAELPRLGGLLRAAVADLFAAPDLPPALARRRWSARIAVWRALLPLARKRAIRALGGRRPRIAPARA